MLHLSSQSAMLTVHVILCSLAINYVSGVLECELLPFGPNVGDIDLLEGEPTWPASRTVELQTPVTTFGTRITDVKVIGCCCFQYRPDGGLDTLLVFEVYIAAQLEACYPILYAKRC